MIYKGIDKWNGPPLEHHGVKGQKWGVRKDRVSSGSGISGREIKRSAKQLKSSGMRALRAVSDIDKYSRLYKRSVKLGAAVIASPQMREYSAMAIAGLAANPAVGIGVGVVAGSAILGYGIYSMMKHDDMYDEYLAHYGVKGMKWGVRKIRETISNMRRRRAERRALRDERREQLRVQRNAEAIASGDSRKIISRMSKMTNEEVQSAINRLNMQEKVYQLDERLNTYKAQEQSNSFFGRLMSNRQQNNQNQNFNNNQEKGVIGKSIDKQIESVVNNAADAAVTSVITGDNFSETFKKKYGYKTSAEKIEEARKKRNDRYKMELENARNQVNTLAIKNEFYNATPEAKRKRIKTGKQLYNSDMERLMSNVDASDLKRINFKAGQSKK